MAFGRKSKKKTKQTTARSNSGNGVQATAASTARQQKVTALKKRLKVAKQKNLKKNKDFNGTVEGVQRAAFSLEVNKSKVVIFKDDGGKKMHISKVAKGKEKELKDMIQASLERDLDGIDKAANLTKVVLSLDGATNLDTLRSELKDISPTQVEFTAKGLNGKGYDDLRKYLETASGDRKDNENYNKIISKLKQLDQLQLRQNKSIADMNVMQQVSKDIQALIPLATSTKAFKKAERNKALENVGFLLRVQDDSVAMTKLRIKNTKMISLNRAEDKRAVPLLTTQPGVFTSTGGQQGASGSYFFKSKDGKKLLGIFKPESQEGGAKSGTAPRGDAAIREVVGFEVAKKMGLGVVPETRLAGFTNNVFTNNKNNRIEDSSSEKQVGSFQTAVENIEGDFTSYLSDQTKSKKDFDADSLQQMAVLDILTLNADRHGENVMFDDSGKLHAIDQGEIIPNPNRFFGKFGNKQPDSGWAWADVGESNQAFSSGLKAKILALDVDQFVKEMQTKAEEASKRMATVTGEKPEATALSQDNLDMMRFAGRALKLAVAAGLTPAQIETMFKDRGDATRAGNSKKTAKEAGGGEFAKFINATFFKNHVNETLAKAEGKPVPPRAFDFDKSEAVFREQMTQAMARLKVDMNQLQVPANTFSKAFENNPGSPAPVNPQGAIPTRPTGLWARYQNYKQRNKDKKVVGDLEKFNSNTASDVFKVATQGPIGKTGTNLGFAKKATVEGDLSNDTTSKLGIDQEDDIPQEDGTMRPGKLKEHPNLIARQVISSRVDRMLGVRVLASEVFSKDKDGGVIGISARVDGLAVKEQQDERTELFRNFDLANPNTQKGLSDLQLMDALTGQLDRHEGNIFIDPATGKVSGIDNDMAFSAQNAIVVKENSLNDQFSRDVNGKLAYKQEQIDINTARQFLSIDRDELESILKGRKGDAEKLDDAAIQHTLDRFDAIKQRILDLANAKPKSKLIAKWDDQTFNDALTKGTNVINVNATEFSNYAARAADKFVKAGDPTNPSLIQAL